MGYLHIENLYKNQEILLFKECYALEKIHGTSAHISWNKDSIKFFSGGENHERFVKLFAKDMLIDKCIELNLPQPTIIYGEAYGGKQQGMADTYGKTLGFIVFDIKIEDNWLAVPQAEEIAKSLGLEFVSYIRISTELYDIDMARDTDSIQAMINGMGTGKKREGIVLRPLTELKKNNGQRIIVKHKREDFQETKTPRKVKYPHNISIEKLKILTNAKEVAEEWVTLMRLNHVLDKLNNPSIEKMKDIINAMREDVKREGEREIIWSKPVEKAIGKKTAQLMKQYLKNKLKENK